MFLDPHDQLPSARSTIANGVDQPEIVFWYHARMGAYKRKPLACFLLLLAIFLQGMLPFLHAHTGLTAITGVHAPDARVYDYSIESRTHFSQTSLTDEEESVVKVGVGLSHKDNDPTVSRNGFNDTDLSRLPRPVLNLARITRPAREHSRSFIFYASERLPPPALAPPAQTYSFM